MCMSPVFGFSLRREIRKAASTLLSLLLLVPPNGLGQLVAATAPSAIVLNPVTSPTAAEPGVTLVNLTGTGFPAGAITPAQVTVTLTPSATGSSPAMKATTTAVTTIVGTTRRVTFQVFPSDPAQNVQSPTNYAVSLAGSANGTAFGSSSPALLVINPPATLTSISPASEAPGQALTVNLTGQFSNFFQGSTQASFGAGISVGGAAAGVPGPVTVLSSTAATAQLVIDPASSPGVRDVSVRTGAEIAVRAAGFVVTGTGTITQLTPNSGAQGQVNLSVAITGQLTHFTQGSTQVSFGSGVLVNTVNVTDATHLFISLTIPTSALVGTRTVLVTTGRRFHEWFYDHGRIARLSGDFTKSSRTRLFSPDRCQWIFH